MGQSEPVLISVITVCLNAQKHIEQTIRSVLEQTYRFVEYIIVDGGSTDGTCDIIDRYRNRISHVVSEKDSGIADAMNKGISLASGEYILFLHADDYLADAHVLDNVSPFLGTADIVACPIKFGEKLATVWPRGVNFRLNFKGIPHQGVLCRRDVLKRLNGFDIRFKVCMDYDFFLRAYRSKARFARAPVVLSVMRDTGISSRRDWRSLEERFSEERMAHEKNCPSALMHLCYILYWSLYIPYRRILYALGNSGRDSRL